MHANLTGKLFFENELQEEFRLTELVAKGQGIAILEKGLSFGGGSLQNYGLNSNTSANGFLKCLYK